jgi:cell division protein FtsL
MPEFRKDQQKPKPGIKPAPTGSLGLGASQRQSPVVAWLNKLSRREQVLLGVLMAVIVIAVISFLVVLPSISRIDSLNSEIATLQQQKDALVSKADKLPDYQAQYDAAQQDYRNYQQFYYPFMDPEMIDSTVTGMLLDHGLTPVRLSMTEIGHESVPPFLPQTLVPKPQADGSGGASGVGGGGEGGGSSGGGAAADGDEGADGSGGGAGGAAGSTGGAGAGNVANRTPSTNITNGSADGLPTNATVYCYTVTVEASGWFDGLLDFLEGVRELKAMEVLSYSYDEHAAGSVPGIEGGTIMLTLKLYIFIDGSLADPASGAGSAGAGAGATGGAATRPGS